MVPGVSVMEMTRKVAYKQNVGSKTAKFVCLKIKNNTVKRKQYYFKVKTRFLRKYSLKYTMMKLY